MINNKLKIILSVLCASALNIPSSAQAQNKYITSGTVAESGSSYQSISNRAALEVTGSMTSYSGTGITLSATFNSGNGRYGAYVYNQGSLALTSGSIITSGSSSGFGVYLNGTSTARLNDVGITTEGDNAQGIRATGSSTLTGQNISIATTGSASHGVLLQNGSHAEIDGLTVVTGSASGIRLETSSSASLSNVNVAVSADNTDNSFGVYVNGTSRIEIDGLTITATDAYGIYLTNGSSGSFAGVNITTVGGQTGVSAFNASVADLGDGAVIRVSGTYVGPHFIRGIDVSGTGSIIRGSGMDIETNGVYLVTSDTVWQGMAGVKVSNGGFLDLGENTRITALGVTDEGRGSPGIFVQGDTAVGTVTGTGVMVNATGAAVQVVNAGYVELTDGNLSGGQNGISISGTQASEIVITGGTITAQTGDIVHGSSYLGSLTLVESTNSTITISDAVLNASGLVGTDQDGLLVVNFNNVDASNAGGITMDSETSGTTTVNVNGGSGVYGDVTNSGSGELNVNFDHSGLTGDVTNDGDGTLTITLDNGSSGTGGFNGGNLNINDSESSWTFDKDSHVNDALNNGTLNIGDKDVTFDNLTNNGKINLDVNSDSGAGGSVNVTGTAGGNGTVHVDTTGNGSLDPNSVLPGLVSGDGTENWTWDPVDWGLEKVIKDGNHFTRDGISSAGAVLNSSNAVQQAMWFAQQNSLLKRMGELRFNAPHSSSAHPELVEGLIENVWIRSYGQQLNVGGKVSGHSYEQMVYGVDLGTDHRWTLDDHNVIYTGVYAGYGRSDIDYRVANTDGELNSYYGGLYATWLHDSGLYIDLTFKAASVDNELKAPYGANQLTADYNDLNLGGSIEIGRKFTFKDDWFIEPQAQVNYLHILAEDYHAAGMSIEAQDLDAIQFRVGSLFGRTIKLSNGGAIQPYLKVSGVEMVSSGGAIRNGYQSIRSNIDGARAELGGGIIWQMDDQNQLHFDYEASFGDKYDKPWGLTAGFRHQF